MCAEFQSIGLANRFELVFLEKPGVPICLPGASLVTDGRAPPFPGFDAVS